MPPSGVAEEGLLWARPPTEVVNLHLLRTGEEAPRCRRDVARVGSREHVVQGYNAKGVFTNRPSTPEKKRALQSDHNKAFREWQASQKDVERTKALARERRTARKLGVNVVAHPGIVVLHMDPSLHNASPARILAVHSSTVVGQTCQVAWMDDGSTDCFNVQDLVVPR